MSEVFGLGMAGRMRGEEPTPTHRPRTSARARERVGSNRRKSLCHMGLGPWS
jgi:hypothetical protein